MHSLRQDKIFGQTSLLAILIISSISLLILPSIAASFASGSSGPSTLPSKIFVSSPPTGDKGPDDITRLAIDGVDGGKALIWTNFQNGINPDGTPGTSGGLTQSTIAGYDPTTGALIRTIHVTGKVDGLTADPSKGTLIATDNEDSNSAINIIYPAIGAVATYTYSPDPAVSGNGGTDSIAVHNGQIYLAHSNPNDVTQPTEYLVNFDVSTLTANLTPVFFDNSTATDAVSGNTVTLGLADPDTNFIMPNQSPRFAGELATIGQADGQIVFAKNFAHTLSLTVLNVTDNKSGNVPPLDGIAVATSNHGTLYVIDASASKILALDTTGWPTGTVFVGEPKDNGNPIVGTLDLSTGKVTPLGNSFVSPKGLLFVPDNEQNDDNGNNNKN
jgi:hypothetical protein